MSKAEMWKMPKSLPWPVPFFFSDATACAMVYCISHLLFDA